MPLPSLQKLRRPKQVFLRWKDTFSKWTFKQLQSLVVKDLMGQ
jgi:hypothetical protein